MKVKIKVVVRNIGAVIGWSINRVVKIFGNMLSLGICCVCPVHKNRVVCWSYDFKQYSCNPRYLTEYLLANNPEFDIYWVFRNKTDTSSVDERIHCVRKRSWQYFLIMNTAEFLITNSRTDPWRIYWHKRSGQKYLQLWHGGVALKRVERDAKTQLGFSYVQKAIRDSRACDLMISGCSLQTELVKSKFWYDGEILECGIPRNDIFFYKEFHAPLREKVCRQYGVSPDSRIVLYAPTFRRNRSIEPYRIDWEKVVSHLSKFYGGGEVTVLLRLHPNLLGRVDVSSLINHWTVIDVTKYHDMQELLCISDMLITDYSSSMFDYTMQMRPCLLYATDIELYDRGYYFDLQDLPYPLARTEQELIAVIDSFDEHAYQDKLQTFFTDRIGLMESGRASSSLAEWMVAHSMANL